MDKKSSKRRRRSEELGDEAASDPWYSMLWQVIADRWNHAPVEGGVDITDHDVGGFDWGDSD
jgi:hypothetical protein